MFRKIIYSLLIILLAFVYLPIKYIDIDLQLYYNEVMEIIETSCPNGKYFHPRQNIVMFNTLPNDAIGECRSNNYYSVIFIDKNYWEVATTEADKFQLVAHEMAHCFLNKEHSENMMNYMYWAMFPLSKELTKEQLKEDSLHYCGGQNGQQTFRTN